MKYLKQKHWILFFALLGAGIFLCEGRAHAASIDVSSGASDVTVNGNCSIHEAVESARTNSAIDACTAGSGADTLNLPDGVYSIAPSSVNLNFGHDTLTIDGASRDGTIIDGTGGYGMTYGGGSGLISVTLSSLTVRNSMGIASNSNTQANLTIINTLWHNNEVSGSSDGIIEANGDAGPESLIISDSEFRDNTGFLFLASSYQGFASAELTNLEVYDNDHASGNSDSLMRVRTAQSITTSNVNIFNNEGGLELYSNDILAHDINYYQNTGGALNFIPDPPNAKATAYNISVVNNQSIGAFTVVSDAGGYELDMYNVTIAENDTQYPALFLMSDENDPLTGTISNISIANNSRTGDFGLTMPAGVGIFSSSNIPPTVVFSNVLLANNLDEGTPRNCEVSSTIFAWVSGGYNLSTDNTCTNLNDESSDLHSANAALGALTEENETWIMPLQAGSSAINAGATIAGIPTDQRGVSRPQGSAYDIGAYEALGATSGAGGGGQENADGGSSSNSEQATNLQGELAETGVSVFSVVTGVSIVMASALYLKRRIDRQLFLYKVN